MAGVLVFLAARGEAPPPPAPPPPPKTVVEVREVERKVEIKVPYVPASCKEAIALAGELQQLVSDYEKAFGKENAVLTDAYTAIGTRDWNALNEVSERQRAVKGETIGILLNIRAKGNSLNGTLRQCDMKAR